MDRPNDWKTLKIVSRADLNNDYLIFLEMEGGFWEGVLWGMGFRRTLEEEERKKKCRFCGRLIPVDSKFCPYCGKKLTK